MAGRGKRKAPYREKGRKNLKRIDGGFMNEHGVIFSEADRKALESAVNSANRKRKRMLAQEAALDRMEGGKPTGEKVLQLQLMGRESDFIIQPKSKSLQRFTNRESFENYLDSVRRVNQRDYIDERVRLYKRNHLQAIEENIGDKGVLMKIRMMKPKEYMQWVQSNEDVAEIHFIYDETARQAKANQIRQSLGMRELDENDEDYLDDLDAMDSRRQSRLSRVKSKLRR